MIPLTDKAIDIRNLKYFKFLSNLQGNILKGHGRDYTNNIFINFKAGKKDQVRAWLKAFTEANVTSALTQLKETDQFKRNKVSGGIFSTVLVSASGYKYLEGISTLPPAFDKSFDAGMKAANLNDPLPATWDPGLAGDIHILILIADAIADKVSLLTKSVIDDILDNDNDNMNPLGQILTIEYGNAIRNANGDGLEHFGYVDGISQPLFLKDDVDAYSQELVPIYQPAVNKFDVSAALSLVITPDPFITDTNQDACGSYFVFRKLEQQVRSFKEHEKQLATSLGLVGDDKERAGAMIVGRFEDGTPLTLEPEANIYQSGIANNFDYSADGHGAKCPYHSHIRKVNPRSGPGDKGHIMARRGIPFGQRGTNTDIDPDFAQMPTGAVGLLFMSYQSNLVDHFEFIQKSWANNVNFPTPATGKDPLIGETNPVSTSSKGNFAKKWGDAASLTSATFPDFVTMKGGEYFFAPSLAYLTK